MMKFTVALVLSFCLAAGTFGDKSIAASDPGSSYLNKRDVPANGQQQSCVSLTTVDGQKATVCGEPAQLVPTLNRNFEETAVDGKSEKASEARTLSLLHKKFEKPAQIYFVQQPQQYVEKPHVEYVERPHVEYVPKPVYQPIYVEKPVPVYVPQPVYQPVQQVHQVQPVQQGHPLLQHELCNFGSYGKSAGPEGMIPFSRSVETVHYVNKMPVSRNFETSGPIGYGGMTGYGAYGNMGMNGMGGIGGIGYNGINRGYGMVRPTVMPYRYRSADETEAPTLIDGYVTGSEVANMANTEWNTMRSVEEQPSFGMPEPQMADFSLMESVNNMRAAEQPTFGFPGSEIISTPIAYGQPQFINSIQPQYGAPMTMRNVGPVPMGLAAPTELIQNYPMAPMMRTANDMIYPGLFPMTRTVEVPTGNNMQQPGKIQTKAPSKDSKMPPLTRREAEQMPKDGKPIADQTKTVSDGVTKN